MISQIDRLDSLYLFFRSFKRGVRNENLDHHDRIYPFDESCGLLYTNVRENQDSEAIILFQFTFELTLSRRMCIQAGGTKNAAGTTLHNRCSLCLRTGNGTDRLYQLRQIQDTGRIFDRRKTNRRMVYRFCIRNDVFLCSRICRLCRSAWLEHRDRCDLDRHRQCGSRMPAFVASVCEQNTEDDKKTECKNDARLL